MHCVQRCLAARIGPPKNFFRNTRSLYGSSFCSFFVLFFVALVGFHLEPTPTFFLKAQWGNSPTYFFCINHRWNKVTSAQDVQKGARKLKQKSERKTNVNSPNTY